MVLARYINARRKEEDWRKEEVRKKAEEGKALRMSELGGSSPLRVVQRPLPSIASIE
jgi:hypothetical protein